MASDLTRKEEGSLLIEAVSLLVQRQRETEGVIAEQIEQAEERATAAERRYAELEARLIGIEDHLARLVHEIAPAAHEAAADERLERLREQIEGLKAGDEGGRAVRSATALSSAAAPAGLSAGADGHPALPSAVSGTSGVGFWELLGSSPQDRFGAVLIFAGAVAVLYAVLVQFRL